MPAYVVNPPHPVDAHSGAALVTEATAEEREAEAEEEPSHQGAGHGHGHGTGHGHGHGADYHARQQLMAGTALDAMLDGNLRERAKADLLARTARSPYVCPIPDDVDPPIQMSA